jgi:DNA modification methylase
VPNQILNPTDAPNPGTARLAVVYQPIDRLKIDPRNPHQHTPKHLNQLMASIGAFGFYSSAIVDGDGNVICGHGRILACKKLGWSEIPTIPLEGLSEAKRRALMLADNKLAENPQWDDRLLGEQLRDLTLAELDFSIEVTGFEMGEIDMRIGGLDSGETGSTEDPADAPIAPATGPVVSELGDLWLLGDHRVLCGNVLDQTALETVLKAQHAAMVFTDPPYNVPIDGHTTGLGQIRHRSFAMGVGEMSTSAFTLFLAKSLRNLAAYCFGGSLVYACMDWRHMGELLAAGRDIDLELQNLCVWAKDNAGMGSLYRSQHELVFVFKTGEGPHRNNVQLGRFGRNRSNVWQYPGANSFSRKTEEGNLLALHPTVKPVSLVSDAILDCTARGDIVLDGFLGSGTTVIAAERTGRRCYGTELDPGYVDTIIRRWQKLTGNAARHADSGRSFDDLACRVEVADAA